MTIDLEPNELQRSIAAAVEQFARARCDETTVRTSAAAFPRELWQELAQLGVLAIGSADGDGGAAEMCVACESLGRAVFPGPIAATYLAGRVLGAPSLSRVTDGSALVAFGDAELLPWAADADVFLLLEDGRIHEASPDGEVEPVRTLGGERWGRSRWRLGAELAEAREPLAVFDVAHAAYAAAAARRLLDAAAEHARTRRQFGRAIGDFQAVAHPLADCSMQLDAAATLARAAACSLDERAIDAPRLASSARRSAAAAAAKTIDVCHQTFGAVGITVEGPTFHISRRLRQLISTPPAATRDDGILVAGIAEPGAFHG